MRISCLASSPYHLYYSRLPSWSPAQFPLIFLNLCHLHKLPLHFLPLLSER